MDRLLLQDQRPASFEAVRELRHLLSRVSEITGIPASVHNKIQLCYAEAAANIVEHSQPAANITGLRFGLNAQYWWLEVTDDGGTWSPTFSASNPIASSGEEAECGRGIGLICSLSDLQSYHSRSENLNVMRLEWRREEGQTRPKILIVEDDTALRKLYRAYLGQEFTTADVSDGNQALEWLKKNKADLVLSDINMPGMDGMTLRGCLMENPETALMSFIFLTASEEDSTFQQAGGLGIDDFLIKPVNKEHLRHAVHRVLGRTRQLRQRLSERLNQTICSALAPKLPDNSPGWRLSVMAKNTGSGGGDFLLYRQKGLQTQLVVADIMGHDDAAKFFSYAYSGYIYGLMHSSSELLDPANIFGHVSNMALEDNLLRQITLTTVAVNLKEDGQITVASAGHPPPLHINREGVTVIPANGMLLGLMPNMEYQSTQITLNVGERLAIFTDGLFEPTADEKIRAESEKAVLGSLQDTLSLPIEEATQQVMNQFDRYAGTPPGDDTLLILLERN